MRVTRHHALCSILLFLFFGFLLFFLGDADAEWRYLSPMPNQRYGHDATLGLDGRIYVMGGMVMNSKLIEKYNDGIFSNLVYDPVKDTWTVLEPVPGWILYNGKLLTYNPETDLWDGGVKPIPGKPDYYNVTSTLTRQVEVRRIPPEKLRNTDLERQGDGVAIVTGKDGLIYWLGGKSSWMGHGENLVLPYDPEKNKWPEAVPERFDLGPGAYTFRTVFKTDMPPMNERRMDHEAVITPNGKIYVMGGRRNELQKTGIRDDYETTGRTEVTNTVERYDPQKNTWEHVKSMTSPRFLFAAVVGPDGKIYVFGGCSYLPPPITRSLSDNRTQTESRNPQPEHFLATVEMYDPETDTWSPRKPMPETKFTHAGVLGKDGRIYILGGSRNWKARPLRDVLIYDPLKDTWEKGPPMKLPRSTLAAVSTPDGKIYAIGGTDVGAYGEKAAMNFFLPKKLEVYDGKIQDTMEVLDITKLR